MTSIIPFPSQQRNGHARKVAAQLAKARSNKEADHILSRAVLSHCRQMQAAGISSQDVEKQRVDYLTTIHIECRKVGAVWVPHIPLQDSSNPGGAA